MPKIGMDDLPKLPVEAMGPCIKCGRQLLETGVPLFIRVEPKRCGIDYSAVSRHVGLAQSMGGGQAGLALAAVLGPQPEPVVIVEQCEAFNICYECIDTATVRDIELEMLRRQAVADGEAIGDD